jgi:hypothetical protein
MDLLKENGLFGAGLVPVDTPELVSRYNNCLEAIGVERTKLTSFSVDAIGWSPEVSSEKGRIKYLSASDANQFGIILTPDQKDLPIYTPFNSFDRVVMEEFFRNASRQIADLTCVTGLWLDFAHDLLSYQSPLDLLMVESIIVRAFDVSGLMEAACSQRDLIRQFRDSETLWSDSDFRLKIMESAREHGDLRFRAISIPDMPFTDLGCFYTRAFGGVYVLRDVTKDLPLLILEDETYKEISVHDAKVFMVDDAVLSSVLFDNGLVEVPFGCFKKHVEELEAIRNFAIVDAFYSDKENAERNIRGLNSAQRKQWVAAHADKLPLWFAELGRLIAKFRSGDSTQSAEISQELEKVLMRPSKKVRESETSLKVLKQLMARLNPSNVERLFLYNRILFYDLYRSWPEGKRQWCVEYLVSRGHPAHLAKAKGK